MPESKEELKIIGAAVLLALLFFAWLLGKPRGGHDLPD